MSKGIEALENLLDFKPETLDQSHDLLRLAGVVLAQLTLLQVLTDPMASSRDKVSASRILLDIKEPPEAIAERLRRSPFAHLSTEELKELIEKAVNSKTSLRKVLETD